MTNEETESHLDSSLEGVLLLTDEQKGDINDGNVSGDRYLPLPTDELAFQSSNVLVERGVNGISSSITRNMTAAELPINRKCWKMQCIQMRYFITAMAFLGHFLLYFTRANLSIVVVAMTSNRTVIVKNETRNVPAEYYWNSVEKGIILSAVNVGSFFAFFGGSVAYKFGGSKTAGYSVLLIAAIELLCPSLFQIHLLAFTVARTVLGFFEGLFQVALADTFVHWSPQKEKSRLITLAFVGHTFAGAFSFPISGFLSYIFGWRSLFYVSGAGLLIWCSVWLFFISNDPVASSFISEAEREYLKLNVVNMPAKKVLIPWRKILSSRNVYAMLNEVFCAAFISSFIAHLLPLYVKDVYNANLQDLGFITGLPMLCSLLTHSPAAFIADYLRINILKIATVHRLFITGGQLPILAFLLVIAIWNNSNVSIICLCLIRMCYVFPLTSYLVLPLDMGGQYASILNAMMHTSLKLGQCINPLLVGYFIQNHSSAEWHDYFMFLTVVSLYGIIMFLVFGSGELEPWAVTKNREDEQPDIHSHRSTTGNNE